MLNRSFTGLKTGKTLVSIKGQDIDGLAARHCVQVEGVLTEPDRRMPAGLGKPTPSIGDTFRAMERSMTQRHPRQTSQSKHATDAVLLSRVAAGDMAAMRTLYMAHADAVRRFVRSRVHDEVEASDIVHDTMLSVWRAAGGFDGRASVLSWMFSVARNKTVDHIRKQARVTLGAPDEEIADGDPDPEAILGAAQDAARLRTCVEALPERQRAVIHLAYFEEMTCAAIADIEAIPEGTVKSRIYHAKQLLLRCLTRGPRK
ncbi:Sigma-K factor [Jannaschia donghaensis]|uniref:Sigma-K factor n=2 Tax=Jannaschia donghaensis TaxID=420998 RepID=A0A0M6YH39_9RHOB|nr:Sigma-K factor [Jannaschia donghaensis]